MFITRFNHKHGRLRQSIKTFFLATSPLIYSQPSSPQHLCGWTLRFPKQFFTQKKCDVNFAKKVRRCSPSNKKHPVRIAIENLQPKNGIEIPRKDFTWKSSTPQRLCNEIQKKTNKRFKVSTLIDNSGWIVERLEQDVFIIFELNLRIYLIQDVYKQQDICVMGIYGCQLPLKIKKNRNPTFRRNQ